MKCFICFYFFLFSIATHGQSNRTLPKCVVKIIEKRIELGLNPSIVIGIIDKDGTHYYNFGNKSAYGSEADEHTIYEIGSITQVFTATLLAQQDIDGKLKIDDPIKNYLPSQVRVPQRGKKEITFGRLSDHTSGLPRRPDNMSASIQGYADYTVDSMYSFLSGYELPRNIGSGFAYSNFAPGLLGHILALNEGLTYESLMIKTIASPLGMNETKITLDEEMKKNLAIGHTNGIKTKSWLCPTLDGAGSIRSSVYDILKFLAANMDSVKTPLQSAIVKTHDIRRIMWFTRMGLAWKIGNWSKNGIIWHGGRTWGYSSFAGFDKTRGIGVVVLTNSTESVEDIGFYLLNPRGKLCQTKSSKALKSYPYDIKKKKTACKPPLAENHWSEDRSLMKKKGYGEPKHPFLARLVRKNKLSFNKQIKNPTGKQFLEFKNKKRVPPSPEKKKPRSRPTF